MTQTMIIAVDETDADPERLEALSLQLREELLATDAEQVVRLSAGEAPVGARSPELAAVGGLVVTLASSLGSITQVVDVVRRWLGHGTEGRVVEMTIGDHHLKLAGGTQEEQAALVHAFLEALETSRG